MAKESNKSVGSMSGKGGGNQSVRDARGSDNQDDGAWGEEGAPAAPASPKKLGAAAAIAAALRSDDPDSADQSGAPSDRDRFSREAEDLYGGRRPGEDSQDEDALRGAAEEAERKRQEIRASRVPLPGAYERPTGERIKKAEIPRIVDAKKPGGKV